MKSEGITKGLNGHYKQIYNSIYLNKGGKHDQNLDYHCHPLHHLPRHQTSARHV